MEETPKEPKKKKKLPIILGVVVVVIVVAGIGFGVWHEKPSFCNAICHAPMNAYLDSYEGETDKYGNELDNAGNLAMVSYLHNKMGKTCLDCHEPTLSEQIGEGISWVTGSYEALGVNKVGDTILPDRTTDDLVAAQGLESGDMFCLKSGCHVNPDGSVMTRDDLIAATSQYERNPHVAQHKTLACSECHNAHEQSTNACYACHEDAPIPSGWVTPAELKKLSQI